MLAALMLSVSGCRVSLGEDAELIEPSENIVKAKYPQEAFDKVENQGGRASCQDDYETFSIMRKSQYMLWSREMLESFVQ